jgi:hypothetical protein
MGRQCEHWRPIRVFGTCAANKSIDVNGTHECARFGNGFLMKNRKPDRGDLLLDEVMP